MDIFEFKKVSLTYEVKPVLTDISFSIREKEFVGILGPNGSGKTTLLKLMIGILKPQEGLIHFKERPVADYSRKDLAKMVSVLPQETYLDFPFTALEVVLMGRSPYLKAFQWESAHDLEIAREAMAWTDTSDFAHRDIRSLSGGERERVLLARALAQEPQVLLLDEPTTHLDLKHQWETHRLLKRLNQERGLTLVVVLHDINFATQACGRILLLSETHLKADGPPQEVLSPEQIQEVFGVPLVSFIPPESENPYFFPKLR